METIKGLLLWLFVFVVYANFQLLDWPNYFILSGVFDTSRIILEGNHYLHYAYDTHLSSVDSESVNLDFQSLGDEFRRLKRSPASESSNELSNHTQHATDNSSIDHIVTNSSNISAKKNPYSVTSLENGSNVTNNATTTTEHPKATSIHPEPKPMYNDSMGTVFPTEITNATLKEHNISRTSEDSHVYYNSTRTDDVKISEIYWVDMDKRPDALSHPMLCQSHRRAVTVTLPFKFMFYGHEIENITIATGGFVFTGDYIHSWLAATQYIAPLMANFDTGLSNYSRVKYAFNATTFTVLWENVLLQDQPTAGNFTFEVTLKSNGDIIFVYKSIPNITAELTDHYHPVKVGLSDAYIMDRSIFFVRRKTIFEYHSVQFDKKDLKNGTVIYLRPLPTCQSKNSCESCVAKDLGFDCQWCDNRCSSGVDRKRQEWLKKECEKKKINETKQCNEQIPTPGAHKATNLSEPSQQSSGSSAGFIFILLIIGCLLCVPIWLIYAYRYPHSTSGQLLIRYRPNNWSGWRKGEARYTAATIHM